MAGSLRSVRGAIPSAETRRQAGGALTSQALSSGTNFLALLAAAHAGGPGEFGSAAVMMAFYLVAITLSRPFAGQVLQVMVLDRGSVAQREQALGTLPISIGLAGVLSVLFLPIGLAVFVPESRALLLIAIGLVPLLAVHDTLRLWSISVQRPSLAVALDAAWSVLLSLCLLGLWITERESPASVLLVFAGTGAATAAVGWASSVAVSKTLGSVTSARRAARLVGPYYFADAAMGAVALSGFLLLLPLVVPVSEVGRLRAVEMPFGILATLGQGMGLFLQPATRRLARTDRQARAWVAVGLAGAGLVAGALLLGAGCMLLPEALLRDLFGPSFDPRFTLVVAVVLKFAAQGPQLGVATMSRSLGLQRATLPRRFVYTALAVAAAVPLCDVSLPLGYGALYALLAVGSLDVIRRIRGRPYSEGTT